MLDSYSIDQITLLKYIEGSLPADEVNTVDTFLIQNPSALAEVMEVSRLGTVMSTGIPEPILKKSFLETTFHNFSVIDFLSNIGIAEVVNASPIRANDNTTQSVLLRLDEPDVSVRVSQMNINSYRLDIEGKKLIGKYIELSEVSDKHSLFLKQSDSDNLSIKGISAGEYSLSIDEHIINLRLKEK